MMLSKKKDKKDDKDEIAQLRARVEALENDPALVEARAKREAAAAARSMYVEGERRRRLQAKQIAEQRERDVKARLGAQVEALRGDFVRITGDFSSALPIEGIGEDGEPEFLCVDASMKLGPRSLTLPSSQWAIAARDPEVRAAVERGSLVVHGLPAGFSAMGHAERARFNREWFERLR